MEIFIPVLDAFFSPDGLPKPKSAEKPLEGSSNMDLSDDTSAPDQAKATEVINPYDGSIISFPGSSETNASQPMMVSHTNEESSANVGVSQPGRPHESLTTGEGSVETSKTTLPDAGELQENPDRQAKGEKEMAELDQCHMQILYGDATLFTLFRYLQVLFCFVCADIHLFLLDTV